MKNFTFLIAVILITSGCKQLPVNQTSPKKVAVKPFPNIDTSIYEYIAVPSNESLFELTQEQQTDFLSFYNSGINADIPAHKRLYEYLDKRLTSFSYLGKTLSAKEALLLEEGNCLSLAMVTTALAKLVGLDYSYQRVDTQTIYRRYHNIMTTSSHVRTVIYAPKKEEQNQNELITMRGRIFIDYFPSSKNIRGGKVSKNDFVSMYYQNLASDAIIREDFNLAHSLLQQALKLNALNPVTLNTLAVLHKKVGLNLNADRLYTYAIQNNISTINLLSNYALYLRQQGDELKANQVTQSIANSKDDNPYSWLDIANDFLNKGEYRLAKKSFDKSIKLAPYLHEAYLGLAQYYFLKGQPFRAKESLDMAIARTYLDETKQLYLAKQSALGSSRKESQ